MCEKGEKKNPALFGRGMELKAEQSYQPRHKNNSRSRRHHSPAIFRLKVRHAVSKPLFIPILVACDPIVKADYSRLPKETIARVI